VILAADQTAMVAAKAGVTSQGQSEVSQSPSLDGTSIGACDWASWCRCCEGTRWYGEYFPLAAVTGVGAYTAGVRITSTEGGRSQVRAGWVVQNRLHSASVSAQGAVGTLFSRVASC
jgi:hypothetical protein